ncbi:19006_t:CDS:1 [Gigaspora rosea]|nr:19006_t:CDS:1 [Gigaspora rosea]
MKLQVSKLLFQFPKFRSCYLQVSKVLLQASEVVIQVPEIVTSSI